MVPAQREVQVVALVALVVLWVKLCDQLFVPEGLW